MVPQWLSLNPENLKREITAALWRNLIERDMFKFSFIEKLDERTDCILRNEDYYDQQKEPFDIKKYSKYLNDKKKIVLNKADELSWSDIDNCDIEKFNVQNMQH